MLSGLLKRLSTENLEVSLHIQNDAERRSQKNHGSLEAAIRAQTKAVDIKVSSVWISHECLTFSFPHEPGRFAVSVFGDLRKSIYHDAWKVFLCKW